MHAEPTKIEGAGSSSRSLDAYRVVPDGTGPFPGVVIIHEIYGLNENIRDIARRFAAEGYVALAVDLFSGGNRALCLMRIFEGMLVRPLRNDVVRQLQTALDALQAYSMVDGSRVGAIGFCMGGSYALQLACVDGDLRAASVFYGMNPRPLSAVARACPIVGSYPEKDFTAGAAKKLDAELTRLSVPHDIKIYPGARHSFFNNESRAYRQEASRDAWARTMQFFRAYLGAEGSARQG
jgi:carboxymethylenebutenolidase